MLVCKVESKDTCLILLLCGILFKNAIFIVQFQYLTYSLVFLSKPEKIFQFSFKMITRMNLMSWLKRISVSNARHICFLLMNSSNCTCIIYHRIWPDYVVVFIVLVIHIYPYYSGLFPWHCANHMVDLVTVAWTAKTDRHWSDIDLTLSRQIDV